MKQRSMVGFVLAWECRSMRDKQRATLLLLSLLADTKGQIYHLSSGEIQGSLLLYPQSATVQYMGPVCLLSARFGSEIKYNVSRSIHRLDYELWTLSTV